MMETLLLVLDGAAIWSTGQVSSQGGYIIVLYFDFLLDIGMSHETHRHSAGRNFCDMELLEEASFAACRRIRPLLAVVMLMPSAIRSNSN